MERNGHYLFQIGSISYPEYEYTHTVRPYAYGRPVI